MSLCEYEKKRLQTIADNQKVLKELGLLDAAAECKVTPIPKPIPVKSSRNNEIQVEPKRQSARLEGKSITYTFAEFDDMIDELEDDEVGKKRKHKDGRQSVQPKRYSPILEDGVKRPRNKGNVKIAKNELAAANIRHADMIKALPPTVVPKKFLVDLLAQHVTVDQLKKANFPEAAINTFAAMVSAVGTASTHTMAYDLADFAEQPCTGKPRIMCPHGCGAIVSLTLFGLPNQHMGCRLIN